MLRHLVTHDRQACEFDADTLPHVLIGWQLVAHTHSHVDTRLALGPSTWPLDLFYEWVAEIVVGESGVVCALQNPMGSSQGKRTQRQDALPIHAARNDGVCPVDTARWPLAISF